jgi:rhamnogalacturonan endolyase
LNSGVSGFLCYAIYELLAGSLCYAIYELLAGSPAFDLAQTRMVFKFGRDK